MLGAALHLYPQQESNDKENCVKISLSSRSRATRRVGRVSKGRRRRPNPPAYSYWSDRDAARNRTRVNPASRPCHDDRRHHQQRPAQRHPPAAHRATGRAAGTPTCTARRAHLISQRHGQQHGHCARAECDPCLRSAPTAASRRARHRRPRAEAPRRSVPADRIDKFFRAADTWIEDHAGPMRHQVNARRSSTPAVPAQRRLHMLSGRQAHVIPKYRERERFRRLRGQDLILYLTWPTPVIQSRTWIGGRHRHLGLRSRAL